MSNIVSMPSKNQPTSRLAAQLGKLLIAARERRGLSRQRFASTIPGRPVGGRGGRHGGDPDAPMHPNSLRDIELGLGNPTLAKIEEWAELYGVEFDLVLRARGRTTNRTYSAKDVRDWATRTGRPISAQGRLSEDTLRAYEQAHEAQERNTA